LVHRAAERVRQERARFEVPRAAHQALLDKFREIAELGFAIATINGWNLLNVSFRNPLPAD
jgi:alkylhydroperoxidase family enzyme